MAVNLAAGNFKIVSHTDGNLPVGINETKPAFQFVYVDAPIRYWKFTEAGGGDDKYLLSIGEYPYTGVIDNKVVATINAGDQVTWKINFQEFQAGYTITLANDPSRGWTVNQKDGEVVISEIIATHSIPPQFKPTQLFVIAPFKK